MRDLTKPNRFSRGPASGSLGTVIDRYPDLKKQRDEMLRSTCCNKAGVVAKYEQLARERAARG